MGINLKYVVSVAAAGALVVSAMTGALARNSRPVNLHAHAAAGSSSVKGSLSVGNVLRVQSNASVYGNVYAHKGLQVWQGLLVRSNGLTVDSGGIKSDALVVSGPLQASQATVTGNLQAGSLASSGALSAGSLAVSGEATVGGALKAAGLLTANGIDGGSGGLTTTGNIQGANVNATGVVSAGGVNVRDLAVTGSVNFSGATVTGFSLANTNLSSLSLQSINLGVPTGVTSPLSLSENGQSALLGVDSNGNLTARGVAAGSAQLGTLSLGSTSATGSVLTLAGNGHTADLSVDSAGNLALGNTVVNGSLLASGRATLAAGLTLGNNQDATLGSGSHLTSANNPDAAGSFQITVPANAGPGTQETQTITFSRSFSAAPSVVLTAASDPAPGSNLEPKLWEDVTASGFTVHYVVPAATATGYKVTYDYHVIGQ